MSSPAHRILAAKAAIKVEAAKARHIIFARENWKSGENKKKRKKKGKEAKEEKVQPGLNLYF